MATLAEIIATSTDRCRTWHGTAWPQEDHWDLEDWVNAMMGEAGEFANVIKKIRRKETGLVGKADPEVAKLYEWAAAELADTFHYLLLVGVKVGWDYFGIVVPYYEGEREPNLAKANLKLLQSLGHIVQLADEDYVVSGIMMFGRGQALRSAVTAAVISCYWMAWNLNIDMHEAAVKKFNEISEREGLPQRLS